MAKNGGGKYALCIGINDYKGTGMDLQGCVNDADDWAKVLEARGYAVDKLKDTKATRKGIIEGIKSTLAKAKAGDSIVIQYSGHGSYVDDENGDEPDGTDECICPQDVRDGGEITDDQLFELYSNRPSGTRLVVISDSCFAGTVNKVAKPAQNKLCAVVKFLPPSEFLSKRRLSKFGLRNARRAASPPGRNAGLLLAASQETETAADASIGGRWNGAFTYFALEALKSLPAGASYREWFARIRNALPSKQYSQTPKLFGSTSQKRWKVFA
jgi:metacaspase-1